MLSPTENRFIVLKRLVITIIVMLILAGVSLNAIVGDNGIINNAQSATILKSCTMLSEFLNEEYVNVVNSDVENDEVATPIDVLESTEITKGYFYIPSEEGVGGLRYIVNSDGNAIYLIKKSGLPESIRKQLKGGEAGDKTYKSYADMIDVYGVTSDLNVYYCPNGKISMQGMQVELDNDNNLREVYSSSSNSSEYELLKLFDTSGDGVLSAQEMRSIKKFSIDDNSGISSLKKLLCNCPSLEVITISKLQNVSIDGIYACQKLTELSISNGATIKDYEYLNQSSVNTLYLGNLDGSEYVKFGNSLNKADKLNLNTLKLDFSNKYDDLTFLSKLSNKLYPKLTEIEINWFSGENINALAIFSNLNKLTIKHSRNLYDITGISGLTNLIIIEISDCNLGKNGFDSLEAIKNLKKCQQLKLQDNVNLTKVSYIKDLTQIGNLNLTNNEAMIASDMSLIKNIILKCGANAIYPAKYSLLMLDSTTTRLVLTNQEIDYDTFCNINSVENVTQLDLSGIKLINSSKQEVSATNYNSSINNLLSKMPRLKEAVLKVENLSTCEFLKSCPDLAGLDIRDTKINTSSVDSTGNPNNLTLLNNLNNVCGGILINNSSIDLSKLQSFINRCNASYYYWNQLQWYKGLYVSNSTCINTLNNCSSITYLNLWSSLDVNISGCTSLQTLCLYNYEGKMTLPANLTTLEIGGYISTHLGNLTFSSNSSFGTLRVWCTGASQQQFEELITKIDNSVISLDELVLDRYYMTDLSCLSDISDLGITKLDIWNDYRNKNKYNLFTSLNGINDWTSLTYLRCAYSNLSDISAISNLTNLTELDFMYSSITDISPLQTLYNNQKVANKPTFDYVDLSYNSLYDYFNDSSNNRLETKAFLKSLNIATLKISGNSNLSFSSL